MRKWQQYSIVEETDEWIAINKPPNICSIPERNNQKQENLLNLLEDKFKKKLWVVHRLDKPTSGLILFAKNPTSHKKISLLFQERKIKKYYWGMVHGVPAKESGIIDEAIAPLKANPSRMSITPKGKPSQTHYQVLEKFKLISLVKFQPLTGRMHQIRIHSQHLGCPLLCDSIYGNDEAIYLSQFKKKFNKGKYEDEQPMLNRLGLHSYELSFTLNGKSHDLQAPLFKDMKALISQLKRI